MPNNPNGFFTAQAIVQAVVDDKQSDKQILIPVNSELLMNALNAIVARVTALYKCQSGSLPIELAADMLVELIENISRKFSDQRFSNASTYHQQSASASNYHQQSASPVV